MQTEKEANMYEEWPILPYHRKIQPHFLFIITPPFTGSTALAQILNTSHRTMLLHPSGEGQWIIPGLATLNREERWNPKRTMKYKSIRSVWLNKYQEIKRLVYNVDVVIEKSPPNMIHIEKYMKVFKNNSLLANNRNPYAYCASILYRNYNISLMTREQRIKILQEIAFDWFRKSARVKKLTEKHRIPLLTYESICASPSSILSKLKNMENLPAGVADTIDPNVPIKVKDYKTQKLADQNERQLAKLKKKEIEILRNIFSKRNELLNFFGYSSEDI